MQERLQKCDISNRTAAKFNRYNDNVTYVCMRPADVEGLCINYYKPNGANWYISKYSWYCTDMLETKIMNLDHFYLWKKSDTGSGITYLDRKGYTKKIFILLKGEDDNVNVYTIN